VDLLVLLAHQDLKALVVIEEILEIWEPLVVQVQVDQQAH
jgi:hypothetical protein